MMMISFLCTEMRTRRRKISKRTQQGGFIDTLVKALGIGDKAKVGPATASPEAVRKCNAFCEDSFAEGWRRYVTETRTAMRDDPGSLPWMQKGKDGQWSPIPGILFAPLPTEPVDDTIDAAIAHCKGVLCDGQCNAKDFPASLAGAPCPDDGKNTYDPWNKDAPRMPNCKLKSISIDEAISKARERDGMARKRRDGIIKRIEAFEKSDAPPDQKAMAARLAIPAFQPSMEALYEGLKELGVETSCMDPFELADDGKESGLFPALLQVPQLRGIARQRESYFKSLDNADKELERIAPDKFGHFAEVWAPLLQDPEPK